MGLVLVWMLRVVLHGVAVHAGFVASFSASGWLLPPSSSVRFTSSWPFVVGAEFALLLVVQFRQNIKDISLIFKKKIKEI